MPWITKHPKVLGYMPYIVSDFDLRPFKVQINERYAHGGGWAPYGEGEWALTLNKGEPALIKYPGDPVYVERARISNRLGETLILFPYSVVALVQPDMTFEVARMD